MIRFSLLLSLSLVACETIPAAPAPVCRAPAVSTPAAPADVVCAQLAGRACAIPDCAEAYARYRRATTAPEFDRLVGCYMAAQTCDEVDQCAYACGPDGGAVTLRPAADAGTEDAPVDAPLDAALDAPIDAPEDTPQALPDVPDATDADAKDGDG